MVKYSVRHYAHPTCYLDAGKTLAELRPWQVGQFPYLLLVERGLTAEAERILQAEAERQAAYRERLRKTAE